VASNKRATRVVRPGLYGPMTIQEGVTDWGEVRAGLRPKEKMLKSRTDPTAMDAGRVDLQASLHNRLGCCSL